MIEPYRGGRPRLDPAEDPWTNRRRAQYRRSKRRRNESKRHESGRCLRDDGRRCPIYEPEPEPLLTIPAPRKPGSGPRPKPAEPGPQRPFQGRPTMLTEDGRRVYAPLKNEP